MSNMSYCRFENTLEDLADCVEAIDEPASRSEHRKRIQLVRLCAEVIFDYAGAKTVEEAVQWAEFLECED